jgi:excisionase family DNA binding protein
VERDTLEFSPLVVDVKEAGRLLGTKQTKVYDLIRRRELPFVKIGRSTRIEIAAIRNYIDGQRIGRRVSKLETDSSDDVEIYTPNVAPYPNVAPMISTVPTTLTHGNTNKISGKRFNGVSQANEYGDDVQSATNFPLVRITNNMTGHVFYARTHNHSFVGVASQATVSTMFDVPSTIELGASTLRVVANGIHWHPVGVTINQFSLRFPRRFEATRKSSFVRAGPPDRPRRRQRSPPR